MVWLLLQQRVALLLGGWLLFPGGLGLSRCPGCFGRVLLGRGGGGLGLGRGLSRGLDVGRGLGGRSSI